MLRADGRHLFGTDGLCGAHFAVAKRHHQHSSVKVICDEVRSSPGDVTIVATGPLTNIASALQQQPDLAITDRPLDHDRRHDRRARQRDGRRRVQYLLRCRGGPDRVPFAGHKDAHPDRSHEPRGAELRSAGKDSQRRFARAANCCGEFCPARFARTGSNWASREFTCTTRWRSWPRCEPDLFTTERMYGDVETDGTLTYGARCSIAGGIQTAGRIWTWPWIWTRPRSRTTSCARLTQSGVSRHVADC